MKKRKKTKKYKVSLSVVLSPIIIFSLPVVAITTIDLMDGGFSLLFMGFLFFPVAIVAVIAGVFGSYIIGRNIAIYNQVHGKSISANIKWLLVMVLVLAGLSIGLAGLMRGYPMKHCLSACEKIPFYESVFTALAYIMVASIPAFFATLKKYDEKTIKKLADIPVKKSSKKSTKNSHEDFEEL
ncbi:hypothetical protein IJ768_03830 [Candidatus Saccharibacteria bacterium]|nr:hypothetical protein [Candidatus Saccharibacteria bacterium]